MNPVIQKRLINIVAILGLVSTNLLVDIIPLNGLTTAEVLDRFSLFFLPARYVFVMITLIHLGLAVYAIYQALPEQYSNRYLNRVSYLFAIGCAANIAWLLFWHYELFLLSLLSLITLVIALSLIYIRLDIRRVIVSRTIRIAVHIPFSLYLGWATMATIGNVTIVLDYYGWGGWGVNPELWAVILLALVVLIGLQMSLTRADIPFQLLLIWCVIGILVEQFNRFVIAISAGIAVVALLGILVMGVLIKRRDLLLGD